MVEQHDSAGARELLEQTAPLLIELDDIVDELIVSERPGHEAVPRALYCRYLKRIAAHLHNVLTSLVNPIDQLDFQHNHEPDGGTQD